MHKHTKQIIWEINEARLSGGFTQSKVAKKLGISQSAFSKKEAKQVPFTLDEIMILIDFYGIWIRFG